MSMRALAWAATALLLGAGAGAGAEDADEVLRAEVQALMTRLAASGSLPAGGEPLALSAPATAVVPLGLVLDTAGAAGAGLQVVAVSPGQNGEALGLLAGDRILAANDRDFATLDGSGSAALLRAEAARPPHRLKLEVLRRGQRLSLDGELKVVQLPAYRLELGGHGLAGLGAGIASATLAAAAPAGCGRVSQFQIPPRVRGLFPVHIVAIDGRVPGPHDQHTFRVAAGRHQVTVAENIDWRELPSTYALLRRQQGEQSFEVEVKPGSVVMLAARLLLDKPGARASGEPYWRPEVWRETAEPCR